MENTKLLERLKEWTGSKSGAGYRIIKDAVIRQQDGKIRTAWYSGRGRFTRLLNYTQDAERVAQFLDLKYEVGNDAPRGGGIGDYIIIKW